MLLKNVAGGVFLFAWDTTNNVAKTGDASNITGYSSLDGTVTGTVFATAHPTEIDATHMKGVYWQPLAAGETNGNATAYAWASSTSGITIDPVIGFTGPTTAIRKNVALASFSFPMIASSDHVTRFTGATVTVTLSIDGAAFSASTNAASEIGTTGNYKINLAAADLNGTVILFKASATSCDDTELTIITQP